MPRVNTASKFERRRNRFEGMFQEYRLNQRLEICEVAARMRISQPTLKSRRKNIGTFTVDEICMLCAVTGMPIKDTVEVIFDLNFDK